MEAIRVSTESRRFALAVGLLAGLAFASGSPAQGQAQDVHDRVPDIIVFTHITCTHCSDAKVYLAELQLRQPELRIWVRELTEDGRAGADLQDIARLAGVPNPGVPAWVLGGQVFMVGFGSAATTGREIEQILEQLGLPPAPAVAVEPEPEPTPLETAVEEAVDPVTARARTEPGAGTPAADDDGTEAVVEDAEGPGLADPDATVESDGPRLRLGGAEATSLSLPFFGDVDAASMSLPALTLVAAPDAMHSLGGTLAVFGGPMAAAALILACTGGCCHVSGSSSAGRSSPD